MTSLQLEKKLASSYFTFIQNFSDEVKLDIISMISLSLKKKKKDENVKPDSYFFGIWDAEQTAEEIIADIRNSRVSNREILDFD